MKLGKKAWVAILAPLLGTIIGAVFEAMDSYDSKIETTVDSESESTQEKEAD